MSKKRKSPAARPTGLPPADLTVSIVVVLTRGEDDTALASSFLAADGDPDLLRQIQDAAELFTTVQQQLKRAVAMALEAEHVADLPAVNSWPVSTRQVGRA